MRLIRQNKWFIWLGIVITVTAIASAIGLFTKINADGETQITEDIVQSVTLSVYENGTQVTSNVYKLDSTVKLNLTYELPEDQDGGSKYGENATYIYTLPSQLEIDRNYTGILVFSEFPDDGIGTYTVKTDNTVVFKFNKNIEQLSEVRGTFWVEAKISKTKVTGSTLQVLPFRIAGNANNSIIIQIQPSKGSAISKSGVPLPQKYNAKTIEWTVDVNTLLSKLDNAVITDPMLAGQELDPASIAVYALDVKINGDLTQGTQVSTALYDTTGSDTTKLNLKFNNQINEAYRVKFTTNITSTEQTNFSNKATLTTNGTTQDATGTVDIQLGQTLEKSGGSYNLQDETINWEIKYNYNEKAITADKAVLEDYFNKSQDIVDNSFIVYKVKISSNGTGTDDGTLIKGTDYTVTMLADTADKAGFQLKFNHDINSAYRIVYKTKSASRVYTEETIINEVTYNGTTKKASVDTAQQILTKQNPSNIDYFNKTVKWTININNDKKTMTNLILTDAFDNAGLQLVGSPEISPALVEGTDYEFSAVGNKNFKTNDGFKIKFLKPITQAYTITYTTKFDYYSLKTNETIFGNTASVTWNENTSGSARTSRTTFNPDNKVKNNGFKSGSYDVLNKQITWTVGANYNKRVLLAGAALIDTLPASQQMVLGNNDAVQVEVYKLDYNAAGTPARGVAVSSADYTASLVDSGRKLKVVFSKDIDYAFYVIFKTKFIGDDVNLAVVTNTAALYDAQNNPLPGTLTGDASVKNGGQYVSKTGAADDPDDQTIVNWKLTINANQSNVNGVQIVDTPSTNQVLLPDSFQLFEAASDADGSITATSTKLTKDTDYTLQLNTDSSGNDSFKLTFVNAIAKPYILRYKSVITAIGNVPLTNAVSFSGMGSTQVSKPFSYSDTITIIDTGGTGSGIKGSLKLLKTNANTVTPTKLAGAEFSLQRKVGTGLVDIGKATTDSNGVLAFNNLKLGKYVLKETKAPTGYVLDTTAHLVTINSSTAVQLTVTNEPYGSLKLIKVDKDDPAKKLSGAEFKLYSLSNVLVATATTNSSGEAVFKDVKFGNYYYQETKAPAGFDLDSTKQNVTIDSEVQKVIEPIKNTATIGSLKLIKVDAANTSKKLEGAKFELYNSSNALVVAATTNANGEIIFTNLKVGTYKLEEVKAPAGYDLDSTLIPVTISSKDMQVLPVIKNTETTGSLKLIKVDASDATKLLAGAKFELSNASKSVVLTATTNYSGEIVFNNLKFGDYALKETEAPAGYELDSTVRNITINSKTQQVLTPIPNKATAGSLKLVKVDAADPDKKLSGARFELYNTSNALVAAATTNSQGEIIFDNLKFGAYRLEETKAPTGYELDSTVRNITINSKVQQVLDPITNKETLGSLSFEKVDYNNSNKKLAGAEFKLYNSSNAVVGTGVTDTNGEVEFNHLKLGDYTLVETKAPAGYELDSTVRNVKIVSGTQKVLNPIANREIIGSIKFVKVDAADAAKKLAGAVFKLTNSNNVVVATKTSNVNGEIVFDDLKAGVYKLEETKAPDGYELDSTVHSITIDSSVQKVLDPIKNQETLGSLKLVKVDAADTAKKLEGAEFTLTNASNVVVATESTNASGEIIFADLKLGSYKLEETKAPAGYDLDATVRNITISGKAQQVLSPITNQETLGSLKLVKVDAADTTKKLTGAEFKLTNSSNVVVATGTTNASGEIEFNDLKLGAYKLEETKAPFGYELDATVRNITVSVKAQQLLTVKNQETLGSIKLVKVDQDEVTKKLAGAEFKLYDASDKLVATETSDANGLVEFTGLKLGAYTFKETIAPVGYVLNGTERSATITVAAPIAQQQITNKEILGSLKLIKVDQDETTKKLAGAEFKLYDASDKLVATDTSDANGVVEFKDLKMGAYTFKETVAPTGYVLNGIERSVNITLITPNVQQEIANKEILGSLKLTKVDVDDTSKKLSGAEFKLYNSSDAVVATATTDANGVVEFKDLKLGAYTFKETVAPVGYVLNGTERSANLTIAVPNVTQQITNKEILGSIKLTKVDQDEVTKKLAGAEFKLYDASDVVVATATTDANGVVEFKNLKLGTYTFKETAAPVGYILNGIERSASLTIAVPNVTQQITNKEILGSIKLTKVDQDEVTKKLSGAEFKLYNSSDVVVATATTDASGVVEFKDLKLGAYTFKETLAPVGYVLNGTERSANLTIAVPNVTQLITNKEILGSLKLTKVDQDEVTKKLAGAEFKLYDATDKLIATETSDANGIVEFSNLKLGAYTFKETVAPVGYVLNGTERSANLTIAVPNVTQQITNKEILGSLKLTKVDVDDTTKKLAGAEFKLYDASDKLVATETSDTNGIVEFKNLKMGAYTFKETVAPTGYVLNGTERSANITLATPDVTQQITNKEILGSLKLTKVDQDEVTKKLAGAEFKLYDATDKLIATETSDANGVVEFNNLKLGTYTFKEIVAPVGYVLNGTERSANLTIAVPNVTQQITNKEILGSLKLTKVDEDNAAKKLAGAEFKLYNSSDVVVATAITDANGEVVFNNLKLGAYTFKETVAPVGYVLNGTERSANLTIAVPNVTQQITNKEILGSLKLTKVDVDNTAKKLAGAEFKLYTSSDVVVATAITDANGEVVFNNLKLGAYTFKETVAPTGYVLNGTERSANLTIAVPNVTQQITNKEILGSLKLTKVDRDYTAIKLPGAEFKLYNSSKVLVATAITDTNGEIVFNNLKVGEYTFKETIAPTNYVLDSTERSITLTFAAPNVQQQIANERATISPNPGTPAATPTASIAPVATPGPSATATPGVSATPGLTPAPTASPESPAVSSAPTPQATTATTIEDIPIEGEIPLGGIPSISEEPSHGTVVVTPDGKWTYTPDPGFTGKDKFTITVTDEDGNEQEIIIEVGVDEVPLGSVPETDTDNGTDNGTNSDNDDNGLPGNLPKTGEESPLPLYLVGGGLVALGVFLAVRFRSRNKPE